MKPQPRRAPEPSVVWLRTPTGSYVHAYDKARKPGSWSLCGQKQVGHDSKPDAYVSMCTHCKQLVD